MKPSGKEKRVSTVKSVVRQRSFSERFQSAESALPVRVNPGTIQRFPDLDQLYEKTGTLNTGGNAVVMTAVDKFLKRSIVLKMLKPEWKNDLNKRRAFLREAQIMAQLDHPGIIPVYGIVRDSSGDIYIAMKQICGMSLKELIQSVCAEYSMTPQLRKKERKSLHDRLGLFLRICEAVSFAHSKQVLHGDLKPGNIMVEDHEIYVMDWGNAAVLVKDRESCVLKDTISGTPGYLSPEAVRGECMDFRSEVFSLGLILFEMITLSRAFTGKNSREILLKILDGKRNPIRHRFGLPIAPALRKILKKALDPLREKRYSSASALAEDLRSYLNGYSDL